MDNVYNSQTWRIVAVDWMMERECCPYIYVAWSTQDLEKFECTVLYQRL